MRFSLACMAVCCVCYPQSVDLWAEDIEFKAFHPERVYVSVDGHWKTPEQFAAENRRIKLLQEYDNVRRQSQDTLRDQIELARWCQSKNLDIQRDAHLQRALFHDPENSRIRRQLRHAKIDGVWMTRQQMEAEKSSRAALEARWRHWRRPIAKIRRLLISSSADQRRVGSQRLDEINDPRAITAVEELLAGVSEPVAERALKFIAKFREREATESVLRFAVHSPWQKVQIQALDDLSQRNRYDFVPALIDQLATPYSTQFEITEDSRGNVLYQYVLAHKNMQRDHVQQFETVMLQNPRNDFGLRADLLGEAWDRSARAGQWVNRANEEIESKNLAIMNVLTSATGAQPGNAPEDWWRWWYDVNEVTIYERPVSMTLVRDAEVSREVRRGAAGDCLVAGTLIWTDRGKLPVESLMIGDRVLCEDVSTRELAYRTVLLPTQRPATPTFRIVLENQETLQASGGHLFWVENHGWTKVRHLSVNHRLRTAGNDSIAIAQIRSAEKAPLYNIVVDGHANYYVGHLRILSHDSTIFQQGERSIEDVPLAR